MSSHVKTTPKNSEHLETSLTLEIRLCGNGDHRDCRNGKKVAKMQLYYGNDSKKVATFCLSLL